MATLHAPLLSPCIECCAPSAAGKTRCQRHLTAALEASRRFRARHREKKSTDATLELPTEVDGVTLERRILARIEAARARETNPHYADDYGQAYAALSGFWRGEFETFSDAFVWMSYRMYGLHPDKLWKKQQAWRQWRLGKSNIIRFPKTTPRPQSEACPVVQERSLCG
jgi:hypothetical protein